MTGENHALSAATTMRELLAAMPGAQRALFRHYHIGGCSHCGFSPDETLAQVCERNEHLPVDEVLEFLSAAHAEDEKSLISPTEVQELLETAEPARVVDIRTREEFDTVHIPGSLFFTQDLMSEIQSRWPRNTVLVLVDHTGTRCLDAAAYFAGHGFTNVKGLQGGIDAYSCEADSTLPRYTTE